MMKEIYECTGIIQSDGTGKTVIASNLTDNNTTNNISYLLKCGQKQQLISSTRLTKLLALGKIIISNLCLEDNIIKVREIPSSYILLSKYHMLGYESHTMSTKCKHTIYYFETSQDTVTIIIPPEVREVGSVSFWSALVSPFIKFESKNIVIVGGEGLEAGEELFAYLRPLTLDLSNFHPLKLKTAARMFSHFCCDTKLDLSTINTSYCVDMSDMFLNCKVSELDLSSFDTSNVVNMSYMFASCGASKINLSSFNTSKVKDMSGMFLNTILDKLDLSSFNTSSVIKMEEMFKDIKVSELNIDNFNTSSVNSMIGMFKRANILRTNITNLNTSNVRYMSQMFSSSKIPDIDVSNFDTAFVVDMTEMFDSIKLSELALKNFDTSRVRSMEGMFQNASISKLDISSFRALSLSHSDNMFRGFTGNAIISDNTIRAEFKLSHGYI